MSKDIKIELYMNNIINYLLILSKMSNRTNAEYTYYAGFEREFKKITKKYSLKSFYKKKYEKEILDYKKELEDSDNE